MIAIYLWTKCHFIAFIRRKKEKLFLFGSEFEMAVWRSFFTRRLWPTVWKRSEGYKRRKKRFVVTTRGKRERKKKRIIWFFPSLLRTFSFFSQYMDSPVCLNRPTVGTYLVSRGVRGRRINRDSKGLGGASAVHLTRSLCRKNSTTYTILLCQASSKALQKKKCSRKWKFAAALQRSKKSRDWRPTGRP